MSKFMTGAAILVVVALVASSANAALVLDLQIWGTGETTHELQAADVGQDYYLSVFATVTGANPAVSAWEGLRFVYLSVVSSSNVFDAADITGAYCMTTALGAELWNAAGSQDGMIQDLSPDGVDDVGSRTTAYTEYLKPYASANQQSATWYDPPGPPPAYWKPDTNGHAVPGGWQWEVAEIVVHINSVTPGEVLVFSAEVPPWAPGTTPKGANWAEDTVWNNGMYSAGSSVTFTAPVPEPATMAFLTIGGLLMAGAAARRRNKK